MKTADTTRLSLLGVLGIFLTFSTHLKSEEVAVIEAPAPLECETSRPGFSAPEAGCEDESEDGECVTEQTSEEEAVCETCDSDNKDGKTCQECKGSCNNGSSKCAKTNCKGCCKNMRWSSNCRGNWSGNKNYRSSRYCYSGRRQ